MESHEVGGETEPTTPDRNGDTAPAARWEDYIDVFISPAELFRRRAADRVGPPLITLLLAAMALYLILLPANRRILESSVTDNPEAAAAIQQYGGIMQLFGMVTVPISIAGMVIAGAVLLWLASQLLDVDLAFGRALLVSTYAGFTLLVGQVVGGVLVLLHASGSIDLIRDLSVGPARFAPTDANAAIIATLRRFELFALWQAVLWGVGVRWVARATPARAALVAASAWLLYGLPGYVFALFSPGT